MSNYQFIERNIEIKSYATVKNPYFNSYTPLQNSKFIKIKNEYSKNI